MRFENVFIERRLGLQSNIESTQYFLNGEDIGFVSFLKFFTKQVFIDVLSFIFECKVGCFEGLSGDIESLCNMVMLLDRSRSTTGTKEHLVDFFDDSVLSRTLLAEVYARQWMVLGTQQLGIHITFYRKIMQDLIIKVL